jgi:hypothetical protein
MPWGAAFEITPHRGRVTAQALVLDRPRCGLSLWGDGKLEAGGRRLRLELLWDRLGSPGECLWVEPYPGGARAAICLTDHADFDTVDGVGHLAELFGRAEFRFTKSVFPHSQPRRAKNEPGLDVPPYARLIDRLYEQGTEIAFHGFGPRVECPAAPECARRARLMERYQPTTWIDHGTGSYLFSRSARLPDGTALLEFLAGLGVKNYWSYVDLWEDPLTDLSIWSRRSERDLVPEAPAAVRRLGVREAMLHPLRNLVGSEAAPGLRSRPPDGKRWRAAWRSWRALRELRASPLGIYGLDGAGWECGLSGRWVFDTVLLKHPAAQLQPSLVERLCARSGLLLGHVYLCRRGAADWSGWLQNISERQKTGDLVTVSFAGLRRALESAAQARLARQHWGWTLRAAAEGPLVAAAERAMLERTAAGGGRLYRGLVGYLEVPPGGSVEVRLDR